MDKQQQRIEPTGEFSSLFRSPQVVETVPTLEKKVYNWKSDLRTLARDFCIDKHIVEDIIRYTEEQFGEESKKQETPHLFLYNKAYKPLRKLIDNKLLTD